MKMHSWHVTPKQAIQIQKKLAPRIVKRGGPKRVRLIAGCDIAYDPKTKKCFAGVLVFRWPSLERVEEAFAVERIRFPYVPGLLSFREAPALLVAISRLKLKLDLILIDGQGIAHPRRLGLASHLGLVLGKPAIGVAKSRLVGEFKEPGKRAGRWAPLKDGKQVIGAVVRTRTRVRPIFVSVGHKIGLHQAIDWTLKSTRGFRIPEPTRQADMFVEKIKRETRYQ